MRTAIREEIIEFLKKARILINENKFLVMDRNASTLLELNITKKQRKEYIYDLSLDDYSYTDKDRDLPGEVWIFGIFISEQEVYIKVKINSQQLVCISFHPAQDALCYPYKQLPKG